MAQMDLAFEFFYEYQLLGLLIEKEKYAAAAPKKAPYRPRLSSINMIFSREDYLHLEKFF
ncbi:hypothetical protein PACTADRAFT_47718 [Pachysolen tannophilus NRRL Y-2460]|uniref:Uncharacterized protein n=1 Tax=Pachysolen tannophilus NRRL Y-2460 TaxID=669874 RepID=A0A1E4U1L8_PACTA|nr:hypothetical protein PACTADRAFT_47718 [Pachysolen tannophilus NRRL Y-2460]